MKKSFETIEKELLEIVAKLENENISLEESAAAYEKGVLLLKEANDTLKDASTKITELIKTVNGVVEKPVIVGEKDK